MKMSLRIAFPILALVLAAAPAARAQNVPHLGYVLPAGGQQGTTVQVKLGGQFLANATDVLVSGKGVRSEVGDFVRPMNANQAMQMRDKVQELLKQPQTADTLKEIIDLRTKLVLFNNERTISPVLAETLAIQVTIAPDAAPGKRELRLMTPQGLSNPVVFCIGQFPEFKEAEEFKVNVPPGANNPQLVQIPTNLSITLPAVVNGRIKPWMGRPQPLRPGQQFTPGDTDRYRFEARRGQQLVIAAAARELMPYLADAVPGWFQAILTLYDEQGHELAFDDDYRFNPDPVIHYEVPKDGVYVLEIKDALYRGREDFVYRISIGELPFITSVFPLGGHVGSTTTVKLSGWNLPVNQLTMDGKDKVPGILPLVVRKGETVSNSVPFMEDMLPEAMEKEPNNTQHNAQRVSLPVILNGRIDQAGDWDVFSFEGRAGQEIVAEVFARRLDSPLDSILKLTDAAGRLLVLNDDHEDKGSGLSTHYADSYIRFTLPSAGTFYLTLGDAQQKGGAEYAYRLRLSAPRPDFNLRVVPSAINAGPGQTVPITVTALRHDGFEGGIALALKGAPRGFLLSGASIPAGQDQVRLTLTVPALQQREPLSLVMEGHAMIQGEDVRRNATPSEDMMQAFAYRHLVPVDDWKVAIRRGGAGRAPVRLLVEQPRQVSPGEAIRIPIQIQLPPNSPLERITLELSDPPDGITLREMPQGQPMTELVIQCDAAKAKRGWKGNLIVNVLGERQPPATAPKGAPRQRISLGVLPAIPLEINHR
jgi:hypothetical protein